MNQQNNGNFRFEEVPPPSKARVDQIAESYGLCDGLRVEVRNDQYRCGNCSEMQPNKSPLIWVPDSVRMGDPVLSVVEACRRNAYNGSSGGWCLKCAKKLCGVYEVTPKVIPSIALVQAETIAAPSKATWLDTFKSMFGL